MKEVGQQKERIRDMKHLKYWMALGFAATLPACAYHQMPVTLQPVGPKPPEQFSSAEQGYLMVYTDWAMDATVNRHSPYTIVSEDGKLNQQVKNSGDQFDGGPIKIAFPTGSYRIMARAAHIGKITIPVRIEGGRTTFVYLDGYSHIEKPVAELTNFVKLPDGNIAGWPANPTTN